MPAGRPRKPTDRAQGHRDHQSRDLVPVVDALPVHVDVIPEPPLSLGGAPLVDRALDMWDEFWSSPLVQALDRPPGGIDRISQVDEWIQLENELICVSVEIEDEGRTVVGSRGNIRPHPLLGERHQILTALRASRVQLGIGPRNRAQLGIDVAGATTAAMRLHDRLAEKAREQAAAESDDDLSAWSLDELRLEARELGIVGRSKMKRAELETAIDRAWSA